MACGLLTVFKRKTGFSDVIKRIFSTLLTSIYLLFTTINQQKALRFFLQDENNVSHVHILAPFIFTELNFRPEYISRNETCITAEMSSAVIPFHFLFVSFSPS